MAHFGEIMWVALYPEGNKGYVQFKDNNMDAIFGDKHST